MNENLNLAEILKDCPKGMELDCTIYDDVEFMNVDTSGDIILRVRNKFIRRLNKYGKEDNIDCAKCVIFPKGKNTWEGFVPPYDFKEGDVIYVETKASRWVSIFKNDTGNQMFTYTDYNLGNNNFYGADHEVMSLCLKHTILEKRIATEEEKQKLLQAIKEHGYTWNAETKTLEKLVKPKFKVGDKIQQKNQHEVCLVSEVCDNHYLLDEKDIALPFFAQDDWELATDKFDITTLKPFDQVLVRNVLTDKWHIGFFEKIDTEGPKYDMAYSSYRHCIPYNDETKHLLGKAEMEPEYYRVDEYLL